MRTPLVFALALAACRGTPEDTSVDTDTEDSGVVDADGDGVPATEDCDDADAAVLPGADERCNDVDDDCDGEVDEEAVDAGTFYIDADADGYGVDGATVSACEAPAGHAAAAGDCDDASAAIHPDADEDDCTDPTDYNCDGSVGFADADGDGFAACEECDDTAAAVFPGAVEVCDGVDGDCDGAVDEEAADATTWYLDADGDGHGRAGTTSAACAAPTGYVAAGDDCDDISASAWPGATETCDGKDDDCDGEVDEAGAEGEGTFYRDADGDGFGHAGTTAAGCVAPEGHVSDATDCDDAKAAVNPGAAEKCNGGDDDCDGKVDEDDASDAPTWYADADADGVGGSVSKAACAAPTGWVDSTGDCADNDAARAPGLTETCDAKDNDCDGGVDDDDEVLGAAAACAAESCGAVLGARPGVPDGTYWIDTAATDAPVEVYCLQAADGGGWHLVQNSDFKAFTNLPFTGTDTICTKVDGCNTGGTSAIFTPDEVTDFLFQCDYKGAIATDPEVSVAMYEPADYDRGQGTVATLWEMFTDARAGTTAAGETVGPTNSISYGSAGGRDLVADEARVLRWYEGNYHDIADNESFQLQGAVWGHHHYRWYEPGPTNTFFHYSYHCGPGKSASDGSWTDDEKAKARWLVFVR